MGKKPCIGVTAPAKGGYGSWLFTRFVLWFYGAKAVKITTRQPFGLSCCEGFVIAGGADIDPRLYGKTLKQEWRDAKGISWKSWLFLPVVLLVRLFSSQTDSRAIDEARDRLELEVVGYACAKGVPLLGICRGMQLMNIHRKGTLHLDIKDFYVESPHLTTLLPKKTIHIAPSSLLYEIFGHTQYRVNSLHHQSIEVLGEGLCGVAWEKNGIIQAVEDPRHPFFMGIQWHPEYLLQFAPQRRLFGRLVEVARAQKVRQKEER